MVKIATPKMVPQLKELWRLGFGDSMDYIDFVFDNLVEPEKVLVYLDKFGMPIAMLCMEPTDITSGEDYSREAVYVYAVTTHPRFRGQGIGGELINGMHKYLKAKGYAASILTPADEGLFKYYEKYDYQTQFAVRQLRINPTVLTPTGRSCVLIPRSFDNLYRMRNSFFGRSGLYVKWRPSYLHFVDEDTRLRDGGVLLAHCNNSEGFLSYRVEDNEVIITEFGIPADCMDDVLYALHRRLGADMYKIRLSADYGSKDKSRVLPFAMIKWYDKQGINHQLTYAPYLNHVMD